jgi:hypothetical protein
MVGYKGLGYKRSPVIISSSAPSSCPSRFPQRVEGWSGQGYIADPDTDTLHLFPRDIIVAMTLLHGTMTGAEVDALRLPLRKKLAAISDLPGHIVAFRGTLGRLATVGQAPLALDVYHWFLATLSPFPVFQQYTLLFTVANGAIAQQTFEAYAAYVLPQMHNILAHSNPRPFICGKPRRTRGRGRRGYDDWGPFVP